MLGEGIVAVWLAVAPTQAPSVPTAPVEISEAPSTRPLRTSLMLDAGATCLEVDRLASAVITYLQDPEVDARLEVRVVGDPVDPHRVSYSVMRRGETIAVRNFEPRKTACDELHMVVGVSIALAIDATAIPPPAPLPPLDPEPLSPPVAPEPAVDAAPRSPPPEDPAPPSAWVLKFALAGGFLINMPPRWGGGGALGVEAGWRDVLDIQVGGLAGASTPAAAGRGQAQLSVVAGRVDVCGGFRWARVRPRACVGVVAGAALASGQGFADDRIARVPWVAVPLGGDLRVTLAPRLELELGADAMVHVARPAFDFFDELGNRRLGREFPQVGAALWAGLVFRVL